MKNKKFTVKVSFYTDKALDEKKLSDISAWLQKTLDGSCGSAVYGPPHGIARVFMVEGWVTKNV